MQLGVCLRRLATFVKRPEVIAALVALVPIVVAAVRAVHAGVPPFGDYANVAIRSRDVFSLTHFPLLGSASSSSQLFGIAVNHPGPLWFIFCAPFVWLFGGGAGLAISTATLNSMAVIGSAIIGFRLLGRNGSLSATFISGVLAWTLGGEMLTDAWNPYVLVLPCFLMLLLTMAVASGRGSSLPWLFLIGSMCVQTHIGYVFLVAGLCLFAVTMFGVVQIKQRKSGVLNRQWKRSWYLGVTALAICWAPPLWEQFFGDGNLSSLVQSASKDAAKLGMDVAVRVVAAVDALPPWWSRSSVSNSVPSIIFNLDGTLPSNADLPGTAVSVMALAVLMLVLVTLAVWSHRRKEQTLRTVCITSAFAVIAAVIACSNSLITTFLTLSASNLLWIWPVGAFSGFAILVSLTNASFGQLHARSVTRCLLVLVTFTAGATIPNYRQDMYPSNASLCDSRVPYFHEVLRQLDSFDPDGTVLVDAVGDPLICPYQAPVMAYLQLRGIDFNVAASQPFIVRQMGPSRESDGSEIAIMRIFVGRSALKHREDPSTIASVSPLTAEETQSLSDIERELIRAVRIADLKLSDFGTQEIESGRYGFNLKDVEVAFSNPDKFVTGGWAIRLYRTNFLKISNEVRATFEEFDYLITKVQEDAVTVQVDKR